MKKYLLSTLLSVLLVAGSFSTSYAQTDRNNPLNPFYEAPPTYIGPVFGYNRAMHSVDLKSFQESLCPTFSDGQDNGFYVGFSYESHFGDHATSTQSLIFRVLYNTMPSYLETSEPPILSLITTPSGDVPVQSQVTNKMDVTYSMFTGEIMYKLNFSQGAPIGFTIGPTFDFATTKTYTQTYELLSPDNAQFKRNASWEAQGLKYTNNDRTIIVKDGDIEESSAFRFGIKAGLQYEITQPGFVIVPAVYYNFGITNLSSKQNWRVSALQMGVDIRFAVDWFN